MKKQTLLKECKYCNYYSISWNECRVTYWGFSDKHNLPDEKYNKYFLKIAIKYSGKIDLDSNENINKNCPVNLGVLK